MSVEKSIVLVVPRGVSSSSLAPKCAPLMYDCPSDHDMLSSHFPRERSLRKDHHDCVSICVCLSYASVSCSRMYRSVALFHFSSHYLHHFVSYIKFCACLLSPLLSCLFLPVLCNYNFQHHLALSLLSVMSVSSLLSRRK